MEKNINIPMVLKGTNYLLWSRMAKTALGGRGLWKYTQESNPPTLIAEATAEGHEVALIDENKWLQEQMMVLSILQSSLDVSILEAYSYCETPKELWDTLSTVYGNMSNLSRVFEVKKSINEMNQEDMEFTKHFGKFRALWAELDMLRPSSIDPVILNERREQDKVFGLLLTLSPRYNDLIKHILRDEKLPSLDEVCAQIQKEQGNHGLFDTKENVTLVNKSEIAHVNKGAAPAWRVAKGWCDHCKVYGHVKKACWILNPHLKKAFYEQRKKALPHTEHAGQAVVNPSNKEEGYIKKSDLAAIMNAIKESGNKFESSFHSSIVPNDLIIDSGASAHMICNPYLLCDI